MKVICGGIELREAAIKVFKACAARSTNPMLECIKLEARGGAFKLTATDLELGIEKSIPASTPIEGEAVVTGTFFKDFVSKLSYEQIEMSLSDNVLRVKYGDSDGKLMTMPSADFPKIREVAKEQHFIIQKKDLRELVGKVSFSAGTDDYRPVLKGVLVEIEDGGAAAVALDGYRLAKCERPIISTTAKMSAIVPARSLKEVVSILDGEDEPVTVYVQKNYLMVDLGHTKITTRLLDGDFVNYKNIIPARFDTKTVVPKSSFSDGLERAKLLSRSDRNSMVRFDIKDKCLTMTSTSELGNLNENIIIHTTGKDLSIAFNANYLTDILKFIDTDTVTLNYINSTSPVVLTPTSTAENLLYLVLPVRLV